eukprot:CAMPEP_0197661864 /NCGR_PEP_ID=MMETSP1338-20131121/51712_1 /TAXON_ID=43686 ORGANISM="Pelagodinium beii, Strain RCC1491" /NCGR_SAMPLE_ID=MMETSP1338 /ASSEMBLY_ACC=CAM_ASM_000754 /LENGTH=294 /DNA_ID=CAMNT_0043239505 /DNA_START=160 /DNA_END=1045 /DNA_ORIENTATION=-
MRCTTCWPISVRTWSRRAPIGTDAFLALRHSVTCEFALAARDWASLRWFTQNSSPSALAQVSSLAEQIAGQGSCEHQLLPIQPSHVGGEWHLCSFSKQDAGQPAAMGTQKSSVALDLLVDGHKTSSLAQCTGQAADEHQFAETQSLQAAGVWHLCSPPVQLTGHPSDFCPQNGPSWPWHWTSLDPQATGQGAAEHQFMPTAPSKAGGAWQMLCDWGQLTGQPSSLGTQRLLPLSVGQEIWLAVQKLGQGAAEHQLLPSATWVEGGMWHSYSSCEQFTGQPLDLETQRLSPVRLS